MYEPLFIIAFMGRIAIIDVEAHLLDHGIYSEHLVFILLDQAVGVEPDRSFSNDSGLVCEGFVF